MASAINKLVHYLSIGCCSVLCDGVIMIMIGLRNWLYHAGAECEGKSSVNTNHGLVAITAQPKSFKYKNKTPL